MNAFASSIRDSGNAQLQAAEAMVAVGTVSVYGGAFVCAIPLPGCRIVGGFFIDVGATMWCAAAGVALVGVSMRGIASIADVVAPMLETSA